MFEKGRSSVFCGLVASLLGMRIEYCMEYCTRMIHTIFIQFQQTMTDDISLYGSEVETHIENHCTLIHTLHGNLQRSFPKLPFFFFLFPFRNSQKKNMKDYPGSTKRKTTKKKKNVRQNSNGNKDTNLTIATTKQRKAKRKVASK